MRGGGVNRTNRGEIAVVGNGSRKEVADMVARPQTDC